MQWNTQPECWNRRSFEIKYKKCYECQITFHTAEYSTSREDKGRTIVLKIQGHWGEIAFRVLVQSSMRAVGCWANRTRVWKLHGWSLSLFLSLMLQKDEHLFSADHSTLLSRSGHVPALAKVTWGNASTFMKISLIKWDGWLHFLSRCHPPVYSCYGAPSGTGSPSWRVALLFCSPQRLVALRAFGITYKPWMPSWPTGLLLVANLAAC